LDEPAAPVFFACDGDRRNMFLRKFVLICNHTAHIADGYNKLKLQVIIAAGDVCT
jgi:hypothetical protein